MVVTDRFLLSHKEVAALKRPLLFPCALCLVIGLLAGILLPINWRQDPATALSAKPLTPPSNSDGSASGASSKQEPLDPSDNFPLLNTACAVNQLLRDKNYASLSAFVHPVEGVTFTPYSTVDREADLTFTAAEIRALADDDTVYTWGFEDGRGDPIRMTMTQYFARYVYNTDYTQSPEIGVDRIMTGGNALDNLSEAYPGCRFVDFSFPSSDPINNGLDWNSLKLVFQPGDTAWYLVGVVHGEWTI